MAVSVSYWKEKLALDESRQVSREVGWTCTYLPVEILEAAGLTPRRIMPEPTPAGGDAYLDPNFCPLIKASLGRAVSGELSSLTGIVMVNTCDGMRRVYDAWRYYHGSGFSFMLDLPRVLGPSALYYFRGRLERLARAVEEFYRVEVTGERLFQAIEEANRTGFLCSRLLELQGRGDPPLRRSDILHIVNSGCGVPRREFNRALGAVVSELEAGSSKPPKGVKVMVSGSPICGDGLVRLLEDSGGEVVAADLCTAGRFRPQIPVAGDPLAVLSEAYLHKAPCARMWDSARRMDYIRGEISRSGARGIIFHSLKFCDPYLYEAPALRTALEGLGVPVLIIEGEWRDDPGGGIRTRIQAFLEMLEGNEGRADK